MFNITDSIYSNNFRILYDVNNTIQITFQSRLFVLYNVKLKLQ